MSGASGPIAPRRARAAVACAPLRAIAPVLLVVVAGCRIEDASLRLVRPGGRHDARVAVVASDGARINARLAPALEFDDGRIVRLDHGRVDADGDYFVEPPAARLAGDRGRTVRLRASVCAVSERRCRSVVRTTTLP